jgi:hypothetical protein
VRAYNVAKQLRTHDDRSRAVWTDLTDTFVAEYLSGVNEQVRQRFLDAVTRGDDPEDYHRRFRQIAGLLVRPLDVIAQFTSAPNRILISDE